jgi:hypothetical protein
MQSLLVILKILFLPLLIREHFNKTVLKQNYNNGKVTDPASNFRAVHANTYEASF